MKTYQKKAEIRHKVYEYCFNERAGQGCVGCPLDSIDICGKDIMHDVDVRRLLKVAEKIDEIVGESK